MRKIITYYAVAMLMTVYFEQAVLMPNSFHDRINGHANRIRMLNRFYTYAKSHEGVWFARKDEIAQWFWNTAKTRPS